MRREQKSFATERVSVSSFFPSLFGQIKVLQKEKEGRGSRVKREMRYSCQSGPTILHEINRSNELKERLLLAVFCFTESSAESFCKLWAPVKKC